MLEVQPGKWWVVDLEDSGAVCVNVLTKKWNIRTRQPQKLTKEEATRYLAPLLTPRSSANYRIRGSGWVRITLCYGSCKAGRYRETGGLLQRFVFRTHTLMAKINYT